MEQGHVSNLIGPWRGRLQFLVLERYAFHRVRARSNYRNRRYFSGVENPIVVRVIFNLRTFYEYYMIYHVAPNYPPY